ncbi:carboxymuconolactone decarboxylase family protein [Planomonospora parontospora]|uniref:carboxymuconolactone decarboxylase family protein n=1 Tax=Planomonospora parontospora TaxID=58119 RepID=UPI001E4F5D79|nr:carboxymuconolactone decarboxylase family protein [Planomonospora parontospora]
MTIGGKELPLTAEPAKDGGIATPPVAPVPDRPTGAPMDEYLDDTAPDRRARGLEIMKQVHGEDDPSGVPGDFFGMTVEHLFAEVWSRDGLSLRDRRLLLLGLLVGQGMDGDVELQLDAALRTGELTPDELREIVIFLTHYAGWPRGARLNGQVEELLSRFMKD